MKIGIVCYPSMGGSGILATELGHELALRGHEIHFITYDIPFRLRLEENKIFFHEVVINQYDLFKYPDYALTLAVKIAEVSESCQLDLLHVHYAIPHATSAFLANQLLKQKRIPIVTTLHGTDITLVGKDPAYFKIVKFSIEQSDGITAVSQSLKDQTCHYFDICKPVEVIHNFFVPKQECFEKPLRHLFVKGNEKLLIHSSNYRSIKRPLDVVRIFIEVLKQVQCKMLFLGSGEEIEAVRAFVNDNKLTSEVYFIGRSRDIDPYIASGDLFLLPSSQESFGLAALEALAYGVPVIASRVGGLPEVIDEGKTGYLVDMGDTKKMAERALHLLKDNVLYDSFSREARRQAASKFSPAKIVLAYESFYQQVLKKGSIL
ncbi:MAG: N-acetyl-alpha-D-glucosaminyl L-malate synthase BshA [Parachlamydiaceae bacterium]|nr:N-acetyl-alpha-D-glucosaminyl L-malate synthase BshA [Parachlamydiaceae bacterium]